MIFVKHSMKSLLKSIRSVLHETVLELYADISLTGRVRMVIRAFSSPRSLRAVSLRRTGVCSSATEYVEDK